MNCYFIVAFSGGCLKCILYELFSGWNEPWIDILSFSVPVSIYLHYTAMGALSEESAITASSLSTDLWNNWTKNNAEGIAFLFCLSLLICQLGKKPNQQTKNSSKICDVSCCGAPSLEHCWICEFYLWDELISSWSLLKPLWVRAATQLGQAQQWPAEGSFNPSSVIIWRRHFKSDDLGFWWQFLLLLSGAWFLSVLSAHLNVQKWEWTGTTLSDASHELLLSSFFVAVLLLAVRAFTALLRVLALSPLPLSFLTEMWTQALLPANIWEQGCVYPASCILDVTWGAGDVIALGELCDLGMRFWQVSKGGEESKCNIY